MIEAPLAFAFGAGMVATVNPCGFAMLPAYLSFFVGSEDGGRDLRTAVQRSLRVGLSVSLGFLAVFGAMGLAIYHLSAAVDRWTPWATLIIGVVLVALGLAMLRGYEPVLNLPKLQKGGRQRTDSSMFVFGVSYAVASISCALPPFTSAVAGTFRRADLVSSLAVFLAYSLGMTLVLLALTVSLGMAKQGVLRGLRKAMPYINRISGLLLVVAGAYLAHYGWYEKRVQDGDYSRSAIVDRVTGWSDGAREWVTRMGPTRLGLLLALGLLFVLVATFGFRTRDRRG